MSQVDLVQSSKISNKKSVQPRQDLNLHPHLNVLADGDGEMPLLMVLYRLSYAAAIKSLGLFGENHILPICENVSGKSLYYCQFQLGALPTAVKSFGLFFRENHIPSTAENALKIPIYRNSFRVHYI